MINKTYKAGIMGCAHIAVRSVMPAFYNSGHFKIVAIASRDYLKAFTLASQYNCRAYGNYDDLLNDEEVDIVYIPLPTGLHYEWIMKSLHKHKHVLCEKSLCSHYQEVAGAVALSRDMHLLLVENFQFRFHSQHAYVKELLANHEIGDIRCFRSSFGFPPFSDADNIRYSKTLGGGALLDAGAYTLKSLQVILPGFDFKVQAASLYNCDKDVDLFGGIYLDCQEGIAAELSFGFDNYYQCNYEIWGSKGKLTVTRAFTAPSDLKPVVILERNNRTESIELPMDDHFHNMLEHIANCLDSGNYEDEYRQNLRQAAYIAAVKELVYAGK
jgi:predicted dehydrogenase